MATSMKGQPTNPFHPGEIPPGVKLSVVSSFPSWMMETEDNVSHEETTAYERV